MRRRTKAVNMSASFSTVLGIVIRDAADAVVLAEALAAEVDVLVTGDRDLLEIATTAPVRILNPRGFWEELRSDDAIDE